MTVGAPPRVTHRGAWEWTRRLHQERTPAGVLDALPGATVRLCGAGFAAVVTRDSTVLPWTLAAQAGTGGDTVVPVAAELLSAPVPAGLPAVRPATADGTDGGQGTDDGATDGTTLLGGEQILAAAIAGTDGEPTAALVAGHPGAAGFTCEDRRILAGLAGHAATALANARREEAARREAAARQAALEERDAVASVLQQSLLPPTLPRIDGVDLAATYLPMSSGIGGDFYDVFPLGGRHWGIALGDVSGKGPAAAAVTGLARDTIRTAAMLRPHAGDPLRVLNDALLDRTTHETFCTAVFARLEVRRQSLHVTAAVAGHPPLIVLRAGGEIEHHGPTERLLGVVERVEPGEVEIDLRPGDSCILYTDGATDVRHDGDVFGDERLGEVIAGCRGLGAQAIAVSIERAVIDFQGGDRDDDLAVVVVTVPPTLAVPGRRRRWEARTRRQPSWLMNWLRSK